jgi:hypothetical protein
LCSSLRTGKSASISSLRALDKEAWLKIAEEWLKLAQSIEDRR